MPLPQVSPAWASTAVGELICGRHQGATVLACTNAASYVSVSEPGTCPPVLAIVAKDAVRLPIAVSILAGELPATGSTVAIGDGVISTRRHIWRPARWWDPRPHLGEEELSERGPELVSVLEEEPASSFGIPLAEAIGVATALARGSADDALVIMGFGPGLTPAGDDVVAGALATLSLLGRLDDALRSAIEAHASTRTTALSAALLVAAGRGQVIPQAATVFSVISTGAPTDQLRAAAAALFGVGATSGHDLCAGIAGVLVSERCSAPNEQYELATTTGRPR